MPRGMATISEGSTESADQGERLRQALADDLADALVVLVGVAQVEVDEDAPRRTARTGTQTGGRGRSTG